MLFERINAAAIVNIYVIDWGRWRSTVRIVFDIRLGLQHGPIRTFTHFFLTKC